VLDLLEHVRFAVGALDFDDAVLLVDGGVVVRHAEGFVGEGEPVHRLGLRFDAQVVVAGIVPAATVEAGDVFARLEFAECRRTLGVAVEEDQIGRRHARVVEMTRAVPDAVALVDAHVAHLHRQKIFQGRLPHILIINPFPDAEGLGQPVPVFHTVDPFGLHPGKVHPEIVKTQIFTPFLRNLLLHRHLVTRGLIADQGQGNGLLRRAVNLKDRHFLLLGVVPHLAHMHHGIGEEVGQDMGVDQPLDGPFYFSGGDQRTDHIPAVVVIKAAVKELQRFPETGNVHQLVGLLRGDGQLFTRGHGRRLPVPVEVLFHGSIGLAVEQSVGLIEVPALTEQQSREKLHIKSHLLLPFRRKGLVQVHENPEFLPLSNHPHAIDERTSSGR